MLTTSNLKSHVIILNIGFQDLSLDCVFVNNKKRVFAVALLIKRPCAMMKNAILTSLW